MFIETYDGTLLNLSQIGGIRKVQNPFHDPPPTYSLIAVLPVGMPLIVPDRPRGSNEIVISPKLSEEDADAKIKTIRQWLLDHKQLVSY